MWGKFLESGGIAGSAWADFCDLLPPSPPPLFLRLPPITGTPGQIWQARGLRRIWAVRASTHKQMVLQDLCRGPMNGFCAEDNLERNSLCREQP